MAGRKAKFSAWRAILVGGILLASLIGCSPRGRYQVLSFFFDGVPNPDAPKEKLARRSRSGVTVFSHKPFADNQCDDCHENTEDIFARAKVPKDVCLKCHGGVLQEHPVMHGPVISKYCALCHTPHQSTYEHLARLKQPDLCTQCHDPRELSPIPADHQDPKATCIACHNAHGGKDNYFLKLPQGTPATAPATQPDTQPATRPSMTKEGRP
jgi:predicted CXXCH cytochrome family protein